MSVRDKRSRDTRQDSERATSLEAAGRAQGLNIGWTVLSYLLSGMAAYGGIGWLIGREVHVALLFPIGMLVGLAISLGFVIWRFGRPGAPGAPGTPGTPATPGVPGARTKTKTWKRA